MATPIAGVASGLDLESIIKTFVKSERLTRESSINTRELDYTAELSGVGTLKAGLSKFQTVLEKLSDPTTFYQNKSTYSYKGSAGDTSNILSASTSGVVTGGTFNIEVAQLAQGSRLDSTAGAFSSPTDTVGSGKLTFGAGSESFEVAIEASDTLEDIQKKINSAEGNFGVKANIINSDNGPILTYTSEVTGDGKTLTVSNDNASLDAISTSMTTAKTAKDAMISIDGQTVSSSTNTFSNAINGIQLNVNSLTETGQPLTLTVGVDTENVTKLVNDFVDGYNALQSTLSSLSNPVSGPLAFDSSVRSYESQLRAITGSQVSDTSGAMSMLYEMGITMNAEGKLEISSVGKNGQPSGAERLENAIKNNLEDVGKIFAGTDGIAKQLNDYTETYLAKDGVVTEREASLKESLKKVESDRETLERYMENYEGTLRQRYTALDVTIAQYNATSSYIQSVLKPVEKKD